MAIVSSRRELFEESPIPLLEEDFSELRFQLRQLKDSGVKDLQIFLQTHPQEVFRLIRIIQVTNANQAAQDFFGLKDKKEVLGPLANLSVRENLPILIRILVAVDQNILKYSVTHLVITDTLGGRRTVDFSWLVSAAHRDTWSKVIMSLTEKKSLRESEWQILDQQLEPDTLRQGAIDYDPATNKMVWSNEALEISHFDPAQGSPSFFDFIKRVHPDDIPILIQAMQEASTSLQKFRANYRILMADGNIRHFQIIGSPVVDQNSAQPRISGRIVDVTRQKLAEEAAYQLEKLYQASMEINFALDLKLISKRIIHWAIEISGSSDGMLFLIKAQEKEVKAATAFETSRAFSQQVLTHIKKLAQQALIKECTITEYHSNGDSAALFKRAIATPIFLGAHPIGVILVIDDQTFLPYSEKESHFLANFANHSAAAIENALLFETTQQELLNQKRAVDEVQKTMLHMVDTARLSAINDLATGVAHQISNPLTTVIAEAQMLRQQLSKYPEAVESIQAIEEAGWRAQRIISLLSEFADTKRRDEQDVDINATLQSALLLVDANLRRKQISVSFNLDEKLPAFWGVEQSWINIWVNLLLSISFYSSSDSSSILISSECVQDKWIQVILHAKDVTLPEEFTIDAGVSSFSSPQSQTEAVLEYYIARELARTIANSFNLIRAENESSIIIKINVKKR